MLRTVFLAAMASCCLVPKSALLVEASVFLPQTAAWSSRISSTSTAATSARLDREARHEMRWQLRERSFTKSSAMAIPGYGVAEQGACVMVACNVVWLIMIVVGRRAKITEAANQKWRHNRGWHFKHFVRVRLRIPDLSNQVRYRFP